VDQNLPMRDAVADAAARVGARVRRSGASLGIKPACFPPMTIHLISSGESSGQLEKTLLERAAISQET